jgi:triacylglycerol lipase
MVMRRARVSKSEGLPGDVLARLREADPEDIPAQVPSVWGLLGPFHEKIGYAAPATDRDRAYGDHPRHRLDVHYDAGRSGAPVLAFVHGGGFSGGDKHQPGTPVYDFVGAWAVRNGYVGVNITYRLAPAHTWPAGAQDVAAAVDWVRGNIAAYGGSPSKIVVAGHSAGAVHVASYLAGQGGGSQEGIAGGALLSGIYDLDPALRTPIEQAYYGDTPAAAASTLGALADSPVPLLFSVAELDARHFHRQAAGVVATWLARRARVPNLVYVPGHNHISEIASLGVDDDALGTPLRRFVDHVVR